MTRPQAVALAAILLLLLSVVLFGIFRSRSAIYAIPERPTVIDTVYVKRAEPRKPKKERKKAKKPSRKPVSRDYLH